MLVFSIFQPISLGLNRSDYMFDCGVPPEDVVAGKQTLDIKSIKLRQIEFNTMASSFGGLSKHVSNFHKSVYASNIYFQR